MEEKERESKEQHFGWGLGSVFQKLSEFNFQEAAGRRDGGQGYQFGDFSRSLLRKVGIGNSLGTESASATVSGPVLHDSEFRAYMISALKTSQVLNSTLPALRRMAVFESVFYCNSDQQILHVLLDCLSGSPYLNDEEKCRLSELALTESWEQLSSALQCIPEVRDSPEENSFLRFRQMVILLYTRSKKLQRLPEERRRALGNALHSTMSIEEVQEIALSALGTSVIIDEASRARIANDMMDRRYDLLLLPDRFDCEDQARSYLNSISPSARTDEKSTATHSQDEVLECPICLGTNTVDSRTSCRHFFCNACISDWMTSHDTCPSCRSALSISNVHKLS